MKASDLNQPEKDGFFLLHEGCTYPKFGTSKATCFDFYSAEDVVIGPGEVVAINTKLKLNNELMYNKSLKIYGRSSYGIKGLTLATGVSIIDTDYEGFIMIPLRNLTKGGFTIKRGDRIAQGEITQIYFDARSDFQTGIKRVGGFGSTGV